MRKMALPAMWPLVCSDMKFWPSLKLVFAVDTLSILTMTVADNFIMATVPGAMEKILCIQSTGRAVCSQSQWRSSLHFQSIYGLLKNGKGHTLTLEHMHGGYYGHYEGPS